MKAQNIFKVMAPVDFKALSSDVLQLKSSPANKFVHSNVVYCQNRRIIWCLSWNYKSSSSFQVQESFIFILRIFTMRTSSLEPRVRGKGD